MAGRLPRIWGGMAPAMFVLSAHGSLASAGDARPRALSATISRSSGAADGGVDVDLFWKQGFIRFPGFADAAQVAELRAVIDEMVDQWTPPVPDAAGGSNGTDGEGAGPAAAPSSLRPRQENAPVDHTFMLESATKASFFLEPFALDANGAIRPNVSKKLSIRKIAHGLHRQAGPIRDFVVSRKVGDITKRLGLRRPVVVQTLYRIAPPGSAGVDRHQDSVTLYTEPPSVLGLWLALEDTDESNGCLHVRSGSHRQPIRERLKRKSCSSSAMSVNIVQGSQSAAGGPCAPVLHFERLVDTPPAPESEFEPMVMKAGDLLVIHGALEHFSKRGTNLSRSRESLQTHIVEASARWSPDNWLQYPPGMSFDAVPTSPDGDAFAEL
mmetsp:Transcript_76534/g.222303  ORF Transcript_76534/g.222303 Transcript_76534/m.222303 type:complete len:382 (-) Transcript_76534:171-1316(-)